MLSAVVFLLNIVPAKEAALGSIVVSLPFAAYQCGSLIAFCTAPRKKALASGTSCNSLSPVVHYSLLIADCSLPIANAFSKSLQFTFKRNSFYYLCRSNINRPGWH